MTQVVFLPGILGSRLSTPDGEEVWPPTVGEVLTGYRRIDKLVRADLVATGVVERQCQAVYEPLLDALRRRGVAEQGGAMRLVPWPYDWRADLSDLADQLAIALDAIAVATPGQPIVLLCHSMGGLIARAFLEGQRFESRPARASVRLAVFLAVPHEGAPQALARIAGVGGKSLGLSAAQLKRISSLTGYPAAYQLLPPPPHAPIWDWEGPIPFSPVESDDPILVQDHGFNPDSLHRERRFRTLLDPGRRPPGCRYFSVVSATHETVTRFDFTQGALCAVAVERAGDGTVPIQSATALGVQTAYVMANHVGVTQERSTHRLILMLLGLEEEDVVLAFAGDGDPKLSLSDDNIAAGETYEVVAARAAAETPFEGHVRVEIRREEAWEEIRTIPFVVEAPKTTTVAFQGPRLPPGLYRFVLETPEGASSMRELVVSQPL